MYRSVGRVKSRGNYKKKIALEGEAGGRKEGAKRSVRRMRGLYGLAMRGKWSLRD
jgi:hypothetical protein